MKRISITLTTMMTAILIVVPLTMPSSLAATPSAGTLTPATPTVTWTGPYSGPEANKNDLFNLKIDVPADYWQTRGGGLDISIHWDNPANDFNLFLHRVGQHDNSLESSQEFLGTGTSEELFFPTPEPGDYVVRVYYLGVSTPRADGSAYTGAASITAKSDVVFDDSDPVTFAPATVVSAHFLGSEPQLSMERLLPGSDPDRVDPDRLFVDWPLTSRQQIGQIVRSTDGGDSFRLLFDPGCAARSRPTCQTGGGGDTDVAVSPFDGDLFFSDQQGILAHEALASSVDHGDTFPSTRQHTITNPAVLMDRQWLTTSYPGPDALTADGRKIEAFLTTRVLEIGMYVQGIDETGAPIPQSAPQLPSGGINGGPLRVAVSGEAKGWLFQPYKDGDFKIATVHGSDYRDPLKWKLTTVSPDNPVLFPWIDIDDAGNLYAAWVAKDPSDGREYAVFYSSSPIADPRNNPATGRPGSYWTPQARVSPPSIGSAVFPAITAGDPGRVAITYMGSQDYRGLSDYAPLPFTARWHSYGAVITNALGENGPPVVSTGAVSHRLAHIGPICTDAREEAVCTDRSLLDLMDIGHDQDGRAAVVFMDNHSTFAARPEGVTEAGFPFVHFAKQVSGPSLEDDKPTVDVTIPESTRPDPEGDATWPNTAGGRHLPTLDLTQASLTLEGGDLVARLSLGSTSSDLMKLDLASYNAAPTTTPPAERFQYVLRFADANDVFHLSMEPRADGSLSPFAGKLDGNDALDNGTDVFGAGYHRDAIPVTGSVDGDTLVIRAPASALGLENGVRVFSVTGFSMAGPSEAAEKKIVHIMRTIDATAPYDMTLGADPEPESPVALVTVTPAETTGTPGTTRRIVARVTDAARQPLAGVPVTWSTEGAGEIVSSEEVTDPDGRAAATVKSGARGTQRVTATVDGCDTASGCTAVAIANWGPTICDVFGTSGSDVLEASRDGDVICAFSGNDTILGGDGDDVVIAGRGNDRVFGDLGRDLLRGGRGDDEVRGGVGRDRVRGGSGNDLLWGGRHADFIRSDAGRDVVRGGRGRDRCVVWARRDRASSCER
ncbi:MAG: Ig-like domain-containing protein [Actinomycetota bacterium]|nr:Ig-like domain-containing protein [Actinomycetota bacterium]